MPRNALRHEVTRRLLWAVFRGELPLGTRLVAQTLAKQFGISATPVREALLEMETIGMVEFPHNRGAVVKPWGRRQVREVYHLRRILESEATRCACGRINPETLNSIKAEMTELLQRDQNQAWTDDAMVVDQQLHNIIIKDCDNDRLMDEVNRYNVLIQAIREVVGNQQETQTQAILEHLAIIDALLAKEPEVAAAQMARHINSTAKSIESIMFGDE
ncbi:MAG: GntR family transcriptional regulator [Pirellulales bacterium]|nr:GntR family transcriptional regulator [Pirellulales bacterium]